MPSTLPSRGGFTFQPWRHSDQSPYSSTGQDLKAVHNYERMAAMLHGKKRNGGEKLAPKRPPLGHASSMPSLNQSTAPSRNDTRKSAQSNRPTKGSSKRIDRWQGRGNINRRRKAEIFESQRSAKRQRIDAPELKDEAYIRMTMQIPTPQEYPNLPHHVFKNPRRSIINVTQGLAECRSEFIALDNNAYQCTVHYHSAVHNEAFIGEGRTQASRSVLCGRVC